MTTPALLSVLLLAPIASATGPSATLDFGEPINVFAIAADGASVAAGGKSGAIKVLPVAGGEGFTLDDGQEYLSGLFFSADGTHLVSANNSHIRVWDIPRRKKLSKVKGAYRTLAISSGGKHLAAYRIKNGQDAVDLISVPDGDVLHSDKLGCGVLLAMAVAPDGKFNLWSCTKGEDFDMRTKDGGKVYGFTHLWTQTIQAIAVSPDGAELAVAYGGNGPYAANPESRATEIRFMDYQRYQTVRTALSVDVPVSLAWSPNGRQVVSVMKDGRVDLWDAVRAEHAATLQAGGPALGIAYSADGKFLCVGRADGKVTVWDAATALTEGADEAAKPLTVAQKAQMDAFNKAREYLKDEQYAKAVSAFVRILQSDRRNAAAYVNLGAALERQGKKKDAMLAYNRAVEVDPSAPAAYFNRAMARISENDWNAALADLDKFVGRAPKDPDGYEYRALCKYKLRDLHGASIDYNTAVQVTNGRRASAYFGKGLTMFEGSQHAYYGNAVIAAINESSDWSAVVAAFEKAQALEPNDTYALWLHRAQEQRDRAENRRHAAATADYQAHKQANVFSMIGDAFGNIATSVSNAQTGGASSPRGSSSSSGSLGSGTGASAGLSGSGGSSYAEKSTRQYNEQVRQNIEKKLWNMNNPYH